MGTGVPLPTGEVQELRQSGSNTSLGLGILSRAALTMPVVIMAMPCCAQRLPRVAASCLCVTQRCFSSPFHAFLQLHLE